MYWDSRMRHGIEPDITPSVNTQEAVVQERQGTTPIGLCQLVAASDAFYI